MTIKIIKKAGGSTGAKGGAPVVVKALKVVKKAGDRELTMREQRAVTEVAKGSKSKAQALRNAGFSEAVARQPGKVFDRPVVKAAIDPIIQKLMDHRKKVIARMEKTVDKAGYAVLSMSLGQLNRDIELLSGRPTQREEYTLDQDEADKLDELLEMNKE